MSVRESLHLAWGGEPPGAPDHALRPAESRSWPDAGLGLDRWPRGGVGALLDLALASDPRRRTAGVGLRRVPSAGGRYPIEAHVVHRGAAWRYDPVRHALVAPTRTARSTSDLQVVLSVNPLRTWWRYGPRSLPVLLLDLGHAMGAVLASAAALGHPARATTGLGVDALAALAGLPRSGGVVRWPRCAPEFPLSVVEIDGSFTLPPVTSAERVPNPELALDAVVAAHGEAAWALLAGALTELGRERSARQWQWCAPEPATTELLTRATAPWEAVTSGDDAAAEWQELSRSAAPLAMGQVAVLRSVSSDLVADLAPRSCGQPELVRSGAMLLAAGMVDPDPGTAFDEHVGAGLAVHAAWLAATRLALPARPVGCWIDTVLRGSAGPARLLHALAVGGR
ncbi:hypothetical protein ACWDKQ_30525 [Saccharopolyspora sp. NPDC000995]